MPITPEQARAELARRELAKRQQPVQPQQPGFTIPDEERGGRFRRAGVTGTFEPPRTLGEKVSGIRMQDVLAHLPFSPWADYKKTGAFMAKRQLETGKYGPRTRYEMTPMGGYTAVQLPATQQELKTIVSEQEKEEQREETVPAAIAGGVAKIPAFVTEFAALGGGTPKTVLSALSTAAEITALQPHRTTAAVINQVEKGETGGMAIAKGWGDVYIENLSEMAGGAFPVVAKRLPFGGRIIDGLHDFATKIGMSDNEFWKTISTKAGYHGLLGEWGEERLGTFLRGLTGVEDFGAGPDASPQERIAAGFEQDFQAENMLVEAGVLSAIPVGKQALKTGQRIITRPGEVQPVSEAGVPQVVGPAEQQINVYKTVSGSRTGITEQEVTREGERYVDSVTGEDVILDQAASGSAIEQPAAKVFYHGSPTEGLTEIKPGRGDYGYGVYLASERRARKDYAPGRKNVAAYVLGDTNVPPPEGFVYPVQSPLKNPLVINTEQEYTKLLDEHGDSDKGIGEFARKTGYDGIINNYTEEHIVFTDKPIPVTRPAPRNILEEYKSEEWAQEALGKEAKPLKTPTTEEMQVKADEIHQIIDGGKTKVRLRAEPRSEKELLRRGHTLPEALGLDEDSRRDLMQEIVGKRSMKELNSQERELFVSYLEGLAEQSGVEVEKPVIERAVERLTAISKKQKELTPTEETHPELHRTWLEKISQDIKGWSSELYHELMRIERFLESLDGEENGVLYENIWKPTKAADELAIDKTFMGFEEFLQVMEENGFDPALAMGKVEKISPGVELTRMQQIGVYNKSKNENGLRYLREGMGLSDTDIAKISDGLTDTQKKLADWYLEKWRAYWPLIVKVADSIGMDVDKLEQEFNYSTLIRTDIDPSEEVELTDTLTDQFTQESFKPEQGFLEKRKKRAVGKIELDEAVSYLTSMRRIERFLAMAPVAKKVGTILRNREFKSALNDATYGHGVKLLNTWMQDSIRGYVSEDAGRWNKMLSILRRNAAVYAIGWNIPSVFRQTLALSNAAAVNPLMLKYIPINTAKATRNFRKLEKEVLEKSALVRTRDIDRDVRRRWDRETIGKRLEGKDPFDKKSLAWLKWMDHRTIVVGWKSLYDTAIEKGRTEKEAIEYADKWVSRTQEMGGAKDLPHFFRGGTFSKIITTFENQVNNQFNFYAHDIIGARRRGDISNTEVAYRVMFSHILPAILMGMIGRGGLPKTWKQLLTDVVTYPIASLMLVGRLINRTIEGFSNSTSIVEAGPEAVGQAARAAVKGNIRKFITEAAKAIGAITGKLPAQVIRTIGGAYDLATGDTQDPRRLIWSEWALEQGKKKSVTPPRRPPTRLPTRRPPTRRPE